MQILGNGVDIVENSRIKKLISNKNFLRRIYTSSEIKFSKKNKDNVKFFAKRFAAKEAFVKAIGTGFREGINFNDISVRNKKLHNKIVTPQFKELKNGSYKTIAIYAKKARGLMSRFIIDNEIGDPNDIKNFNNEGYSFDSSLSDNFNYVFTRK